MTDDSTEASNPAQAAEPLALRLNDQLGLVERLRAPSMTDTTATHIDRMRMAADEIERLRDVLTRILQWADAYPLDQFPEVQRQDWQRANALLAEKGISMSAMSASNMRHVLSGVRGMVDEGLKA